MLRCRKLVTILGCASPSAIDAHAPGTTMQASGAAASSSHAGATTSHAGGSSRHVHESEEDEEEWQDQRDPEEEGEEWDAPVKARRVSRPPEDPWSPTPFQRERPTRRRTKTLNEGCSKRGRK